MRIYFSKIQNYKIGYTNKEEFNLLKDEIFNKEVYKLPISNLKPLIIDLGAHIGLSTIYFKTQYPNAKIIAFEPNPNVFPILEENILYNDLSNVELHNTALGSKEEIRDFYIDNSGNDCFSTGSFIPNAWNGKQKTTLIKVKTEKLSKYINQAVDILKIDTEGAELEIMKEINKEKKLSLIRNIMIEFHPVKGRNYKNIVKILNDNNFDIQIKKDPLGTELIDILGQNRI